MRDEEKSKEQLINELVELRQPHAQMQIIENNLSQIKNSLQESEEQYYTIFKNSIDAILLTEPNGDVYAANPEACRVFGWTEEELCRVGGNGVVDITDTRLQTALDERIRTGRFKGELTYLRKDGTKFLGEVSTAIFKDKDGLYKTSMNIRDITKRRQTEEELKKTNRLLKLFIQETTRKKYLDAVVMLLQEWINCHCTGIRVLNEVRDITYESYGGFCQEFWESENSLCVKNNQYVRTKVIIENPELQDAIRMTNAGSFYCNNTIKFVSEMSAQEQSRFRGKCGELGFKSVAIIPIRYHDRALGVIHFADEKEGKLTLELIQFIEKIAPLVGEAMYRFNLEDELRYQNDNLEKLVEERTKELKHANEKLKRDIMEQKRLEEELRKANQKVTDILDSIADAFFTLDDQWNIIYINKTAQHLFKIEEICTGQNFWHVFPNAEKSVFYNNYNKVMREKAPLHFETQGIYVDKRWVEVHAYPSQDGLSIYFHDITERKQMEERLKIEQQRLNYLLDSLPGNVALISPDYTIKYTNSNHLLKYGNLNNKTCYNYVFDRHERCEKCNIDQVFKERKNHYWEISKPDDQIFAVYASPFCDIDGSPMAVKISFNITSVKETENEIKRLSKLNLIGEMAAGIAHEIRNPMTTVKGFLQFLVQKERYHQDKEYFNLMIEELDRANSIITEFLSLAKDKLVELKMLDLNSIIKAIFPLIHSDALLKDNYINLDMEEIPKILLDTKEIRQLILNIVRNGLEVMTAGEYLTIKTYVDGNEVVFSVRDRGKGIPTNIVDKIGTPFFTTKDNGTGLGLATCYSIANRHKATIDFETGSEGTTFYVRFKVSVQK